MVRPGRVIALLGAAALGLRIGSSTSIQDGRSPVRFSIGGHRRSSGFLPSVAGSCCPTVRRDARTHAARWQRFESIVAISRDGDSPSDALSGIRWVHCAFRICPRKPRYAVSRREVDPCHAPLDHGDVGISDVRHFPGRPLGLLGPGVGRLLGLGSGRERIADAVADRDGIPAFRHGPGKEGHVEGLEHGAGHHDLHHVDPRNVPHTQRYHQLRSRLRAVVHWRLVRMVSCDHLDRVCFFLSQEQVRTAERPQARIAGFARVEFPIQ